MGFKSINKKKIRNNNMNSGKKTNNKLNTSMKNVKRTFDNDQTIKQNKENLGRKQIFPSNSDENKIRKKISILTNFQFTPAKVDRQFRVAGFSSDSSFDSLKRRNYQTPQKNIKSKQKKSHMKVEEHEREPKISFIRRMSSIFGNVPNDMTFFPNINSRFSSYEEFSPINMQPRASCRGLSSSVFILEYNKNTLIKANSLRYKEDVFRAASRLTRDLPPYPDWVYVNEEVKYQDIYKIDVGGVIFYLFQDTLKNIIHTKLAVTVRKHQNEGIPFFDRDPKCFKAILNFYRTGRLHVPPNTCLSLYEEELAFWGISEMFIEPCCWNEFLTFKMASNTLKKYAEDVDKTDTFENVPKNFLMKWRMNLYMILTKGCGSIMARWMSTICTIFIVISILDMVISTMSFGRVDIVTGEFIEFKEKETVTNYFTHTRIARPLEELEILLCGFFFFEFFSRLLLCPKRLEFFSDTLNWIDLCATMTSSLSMLILNHAIRTSVQDYMLFLKLPRILRLFRLTAKLRTGLEAFILTLKASAKELKVVFLMLFIFSSLFGTLIFVVEMIFEDEKNRSNLKTAYNGIWLSMGTMCTVGYGELYPKTESGYFLMSCCILCGVIICQLPVLIFLQNFRVYYDQATARLSHKNKILAYCNDPEFLIKEDPNLRKETLKRKGLKKFSLLFKHL